MMQQSTRDSLQDDTEIDILIPAIEKDLGTLPYVIDGVRKYVKHRIGSICIVSPDSKRIKALCRRKGCKFVNEKTVLPITKKDIHYSSKRWDRSGWLYQQLLKLNGDSICSRRFFLVMDADTVLIRPHKFRIKGKTVFYYRNWSQPEYFRTYRKLTGKKRCARVSLVTHYMLFERTKLARLKKNLEKRHGTVWYKAIIRSIDKTKQFGFSEFETYGNMVYSRNPGGVLLKRCLNKSLHMSASQLSAVQTKKFARKYRSLSFHKRKCYVRSRKVG